MNTWNSPRVPCRAGVRWLLLLVLALLPILAACSSGRSTPTPSPTLPTAALAGGPPAASPPPAPTVAGSRPIARQGLDLTILHTNDVRGEIEPCG